jgi:site-specific recombinase XerD
VPNTELVQSVTDKNFPSQKFSSDLPAPVYIHAGDGERRRLGWWIVEYLTTYATGATTTLRYKKEDLELFYAWFVWAFGADDVTRWNRASSNLFVQTLVKETVKVAGRGKRAGEPRWSARSLNRKIDHLRTFAKWIASQVPPPVVGGNPMQGIKRFDVPVLQVKRLTEKEVIRLETAARGLAGTRIRRDKKRTELGVMEPRADARPARDLALYKLLIGTGLRVAAVASLDVAQFSGRRLLRVKEKGSQEREVVMSSEAAEAVTHYLRTERGKDAAAFGDATQALFLSVPTQARNRNPEADGRMSPRSIFSVVRNLAVDALGEVEAKRIHPHLFRHHVGYLMNEKGGITAVQKQLAHRNIAYSAVYAQRTDDELERILDGENGIG